MGAGQNTMLGPSAALTIRQPTDGGLKKGNIQNQPRFTNLGFGGLDSAGAEGTESSEFGQKPPGETQRPVRNVKGSK